MKKLLGEILEELKYHSKLLGEISMNTEPKQHAGMQQSMEQSMNLLKTQLANMPGIKNNPEMNKMMNDMFKIIPKGGT